MTLLLTSVLVGLGSAAAVVILLNCASAWRDSYLFDGEDEHE